MKDKGSLHLKVQELCNCFATTVMWYGICGHFLKGGFIIRQEVFNEKEAKQIHTGIQGRSG